MKLKARQVVLDDDRYPELQALARKNGVSVSLLIRYFINQGLFLNPSTINWIEVQLNEQSEQQPAAA